MRVTDRLIALSRGTLDQALLYAARWTFPSGDQPVRDYLTEVYRLAPILGIDASIAVAQSAHETGGTLTGRPWHSKWWGERRNPAGIGITGDPDENEQSRTWPNGTEAARSHLGHILVYALGPSDAASLWFRRAADTGRLLRDTDPRYEAYLAAYGNVARAQTIAELAGTWAVDPDYAAKIVARGTAMFPGIANQEETMPNRTHPTIVIDAGHRSTDRSGNPAEMSLTDDLAVFYVEELRRRGYEAFWYQRDLDRDADPDETIGDLNTVALGIGRWLAAQPWALFLSLHYDGAHAPLEAIVPDNVGLATAYDQGRDLTDTAANNLLDVELGSAIVTRMAAAGLGAIYRGRLGVAGVMSERDTGVGGQGFRLAVFAATAPSRQRAVRLVIEHGGTGDPAAQRFADFARAAADAIDAVYGQEAPKPTYAPRMPIPGAIEDKVSGGRLYVVAARKRVRTAIDGVIPRQAPSITATIVGPKIAKGTVGTYEYIVSGDGGLWRASRRGTYLPASVFIGEDGI